MLFASSYLAETDETMTLTEEMRAEHKAVSELIIRHVDETLKEIAALKNESKHDVVLRRRVMIRHFAVKRWLSSTRKKRFTDVIR